MRQIQPIRVLIVDDSAFMRRAIRQMLEKDPRIQVLGTANNGVQAIEEAKRLQPDVITLDIEMPEMDGLTALRTLKRICKAAVLMVSSLTSEGSNATLSALRAGASDFITKEHSQVSLSIGKIEQELIAKVCAIAKIGPESASAKPPLAGAAPSDINTKPPVLSAKDFDCVMIGSSTGGPPILEQLIGGLPAGFPLPVFIAQHMPVLFTRTLAERMNKLARVPVLHAESDLPVTRGQVYIAQGGQHLRVRRLGLSRQVLEVSLNPAEALYKPSVNELFDSGAKVYGSRVLAIMLTGMGDDGLIGARALHAQRGTLLAQDHASCVVYGMPKAVTQAGLVAASLNPAELLKVLQQLKSTTEPSPIPNETFSVKTTSA